MQDDLLTSPDSTNGSPTGPGARTQKKIHQVSQSANPLKITIKNLQGGASSHEPKPSRKRRQKEFASPNSDSRILVTSHDTEPVSGSSVRVTKASNSSSERPGTSEKSSHDSASNSDAAKTDSDKSGLPMCSVTISFDLNTQKLWDDLHLPYETYTSFFRHLILLEKYFRNGDLALSENASQKSQSYIKSLQNRIEEFEVKHKRSHADLSAVTRPDLSVPAGYSVLGPGPPLIDPPPQTTRHNKTSAAVESAPSKSHSKKHHDNTQDGSTILRIPKVSMPSATNTAHTVTSSGNQAAMPTTLRVRKDLMFLGLQANPPVAAANPIPSPKGSAGLASLQPEQKSSIMIEAQKQQHQQASKQLEEMLNQASHQASKAAANSVNSATMASGNLLRQQISGLSSNPPHQNLMQLLNDPTLKQKSAKGPSLGKTSLVAANSQLQQQLATSGISVASTGTTSKSSNSQLFKNTDSSSGSSAIPLTFNNSIAEVLAAAAKSKKASSGGSNQTSNFGATNSSKTSEVTITSKSFNKTTASWTSNSTSTLTSSSGSSKKHHQFGKPMNQSGKVNPLLEMRNFLSHQAPGIPPHIVAQNTLTAASSLPTKPTISTHQMAGTMPKIAPKPSGSLLKPIPVPKPSGTGISGVSTIGSSSSSKSSGGITSVNKKSLNTVLDRLSGLKGTPTPTLNNMSGGSVIQTGSATGSATSNTFRQTATSSPSSLVQQLQAPPIMTNPSLGSPTKNHNRVPSSPNIPTVVGPASMRPQPPASDGGQGQSSTGSSTSQASKLQSLQTLMAQQGLQQGLLNMAGYPGTSASGLVGQPMVQYPWSTTGATSGTSSAQQASAQAEALRALALAGAGLPGMNPAAANAAYTEILKMSLQAQKQAKSGQKTGTGSQQAAGSGNNLGQQAPRIRAPPPLTHMGRQGGGGNQSSQQAPNKPHKQPE